jgi:hypothetical protein
MTTALEIVERAFRKINVKAEDEGLTADQIAHGLQTLNSMMHGWELWGILTTHVDMAVDTVFPLAAKFEEGTMYCLAMRLAPDYVAPVGFNADDFLRRIQAAYIIIPEAAIPKALLRTPSQRRTDAL